MIEQEIKSGSHILVVMPLSFRATLGEEDARPILILVFPVIPIPTHALRFSSMIIVYVHVYDRESHALPVPK